MSEPVRYRIAPKNPAAHLFEVTLDVETPDPGGQLLRLPSWIPGSYLIREFSRNIIEIKAVSQGQRVAVDKVDKHSFQCAPAGGPLQVVYSIYAWDLSVRAAHLDQTHAFFNGPSVFLAVVGQEDRRCEVKIEAPKDPQCKGWRVATSMSTLDVRPPGFGVYQAADYDELIDHPVEMGTFDLVEFEACGVPHVMAITGRHRCDTERLKRDLRAICEEQIKFFGLPAPMDRYVFLTLALGEGYGGLEHRASSALICKRDDLPLPGRAEISDGYRNFLGLVSHEYFHLWNVKRIKPKAFAPYDLKEENYTRLLWAFEGITSYYDDLALVRSGLLSVESYLDLLGRTATRVMRGRGRHKQSLADSSFDAWIKFYRPDENTPNAVVSYYTKGALASLALDLTVRRATADQRSLDDVMRLLWERNGKTGVGVDEDGIEMVAAEVAGVSLQGFFDDAIRGTKDIPLQGLLEAYGVELHLRPQESDSDVGGKASSKPREELLGKGTLGVTIGAGGAAGDDAVLTAVMDGSAAQEAGLSAGDVVVAVEGLRATRANITRMLSERPPGTRVHLHVFRRDELLEVDCVLKAPELETCWFALKADAPEDAVARRAQWLGVATGKKQ